MCTTAGFYDEASMGRPYQSSLDKSHFILLLNKTPVIAPSLWVGVCCLVFTVTIMAQGLLHK